MILIRQGTEAEKFYSNKRSLVSKKERNQLGNPKRGIKSALCQRQPAKLVNNNYRLGLISSIATIVGQKENLWNKKKFASNSEIKNFFFK